MSTDPVDAETLVSLREMAATVAVNGKLLIQLIDEIERLRPLSDEAADLLDTAQSGYISGCGLAERWSRKRDELIRRIREKQR